NRHVASGEGSRNAIRAEQQRHDRRADQSEHRQRIRDPALLLAQEDIHDQHDADRGGHEDLRGGKRVVDHCVSVQKTGSRSRAIPSSTYNFERVTCSSRFVSVASITSTSGAGHTPSNSTETASTPRMKNSRRSTSGIAATCSLPTSP